MQFALTDEHTRWIEEIRTFLRENFDAEAEVQSRLRGGESSGAVLKTFRAKLAERGWLALTWPTEHGGLGRTTFEQFLLMDELAYAGAPAIDLTTSAVAPTIIRAGTDEQKNLWLPAILRGEVEFALGYSEPDAGSDLASLRTSAKRDGDAWVVNGQKIWNTGADHATHEWLACRTDPDAPKHKGISVFILPIDSPGVTVHEIKTWGGVRTNQVFFDDVRVPPENLVGELGKGWQYVTTALDFERVSIGITGGLRRLHEALVDFVRATVVDGVRLADRVDVAHTVAELGAQIELARLLNYRAAWMVDRGLMPNAEASMTKVFTTELHARLSDVALQLAGAEGQVDATGRPPSLVSLAQHMYRQAPYLRFGGGTNEVQRDIIAQRGLGLPRAG